MPDTNTPWTLEGLYQIEPELASIAKKAIAHKGLQYERKRAAYVAAKDEAWELVGWEARNPQLRNSGAWDCFFRYILDELNI